MMIKEVYWAQLRENLKVESNRVFPYTKCKTMGKEKFLQLWAQTPREREKKTDRRIYLPITSNLLHFVLSLLRLLRESQPLGEFFSFKRSSIRCSPNWRFTLVHCVIDVLFCDQSEISIQVPIMFCLDSTYVAFRICLGSVQVPFRFCADSVPIRSRFRSGSV